MKTQLIIALKISGVMIVLLGIIYPLFITGIAQACFNDKANGSLIEKDGKVVGSSLIGQQFDSIIYFTSRPSATAYNTLPSSASNYGLTSQQLHQQVADRKEKFIANNKLLANDSVPAEMVFASASGLDPHISPAAAMLQVNRVAQARGFSDEQKRQLEALVENSIEAPQFNFMGEPRVNVLLLNLQADKIR